jgi:hypothetical protein
LALDAARRGALGCASASAARAHAEMSWASSSAASLAAGVRGGGVRGAASELFSGAPSLAAAAADGSALAELRSVLQGLSWQVRAHARRSCGAARQLRRWR